MATFARSTARTRRAAIGSGEVDAGRVRGRDDLVQEVRHARAGLQLDLQPLLDLGADGARAMAGEVARRPFEAGGDRAQALGERREVVGEQREQRVGQRRGAGGAALPGPDRLAAVHGEPDVVELEVSLESRLRAQLGRIERLDGGQVPPIRLDLAEVALPRRIGETVVPGVDAEVRGVRRLVLDHPPEARLDEVVQPVVERARAGGRGRAGELDAAEGAISHVAWGTWSRAAMRLRRRRRARSSMTRPVSAGARRAHREPPGSSSRCPIVRSRSASPRGSGRCGA